MNRGKKSTINCVDYFQGHRGGVVELSSWRFYDHSRRKIIIKANKKKKINTVKKSIMDKNLILSFVSSKNET